MTSKQYTLGAVIIIVVLLGIFFFISGQNTHTPLQNPETNVAN